MTILVTGAAGFIGYHVSRRLLERGERVVGIDDLNSYYDPSLKQARLRMLEDFDSFTFERIDLAQSDLVSAAFAKHSPRYVIHLAAQAGVRYSLTNPHAYTNSNVTGFLNILEGCRAGRIEHLVFASSSSVYGLNATQPFSEHHNVDHPLSLYAATKKANELMAHTYAHLFGVAATGLRFFTVYGPWGRPDMALFRFTRGILAGEPIPVFNRGQMIRDFTYIDDIVEGVVRVVTHIAAPDPKFDPARPDPARSSAPYRIFNIGNNKPVQLLDYIAVLEKCLGRKAQLDLQPMQPFRPATSIEDGIRAFVDWYLHYYGERRSA